MKYLLAGQFVKQFGHFRIAGLVFQGQFGVGVGILQFVRNVLHEQFNLRHMSNALLYVGIDRIQFFFPNFNLDFQHWDFKRDWLPQIRLCGIV